VTAAGDDAPDDAATRAEHGHNQITLRPVTHLEIRELRLAAIKSNHGLQTIQQPRYFVVINEHDGFPAGMLI
jgi:hypothetical protein